jgi:putative transposase
VTIVSRHHLPVAPNVLKRAFAVSALNKAWVSDITYIHNGELVGYATRPRMTKNLVIQALFRATASKRPTRD